MIKAYIGIDPGLANIGLTLRLAGSSTFASEFIPIKTPLALKRSFLTNQEQVNWKLKQVFLRVKQAIRDLLDKYSLLPEETFAAIEAFMYRPSKNSKSFNNSAYDTVAAVAVIKAVLFDCDIEFTDVISTQMRRVLTWKATGTPNDKMDKDEVEAVVRQVLGTDNVDKVLSLYARGHHEHIVDSMAFSFVVEHKSDYQKYMKIPLKKRKLLEAQSENNPS